MKTSILEDSSVEDCIDIRLADSRLISKYIYDDNNTRIIKKRCSRWIRRENFAVPPPARVISAQNSRRYLMDARS